MSVDSPTPWAPSPPEGSRSVDDDFRSDRALCEDGFCLGVMRAADGGGPYRGVLEAVCPICGRRVPLGIALDPRRGP
jgi:hypothetical protein